MKNTNSSPSASQVSGSRLDEISEYIKKEASEKRGRSIPPIDKWHPKNCGNMDLTIKSNGEWWHEGRQITRQSLVDLFSTVLWPEFNNDEYNEDSVEYYLKTPVEKIHINVEDVPFLVNQVNIAEKKGLPFIEFITNTGDVVYLDDEHPLEMRAFQGEYRPYIAVRFGMKGLISRNVLMHLVKMGELTEKNGETSLTLKSGGKQYEVSVPN